MPDVLDVSPHTPMCFKFVLHRVLQMFLRADTLHVEQDTEWLTLTLSCPSPVTV